MTIGNSGRRIARICVYCGSSKGARPIYRETAAELGKELAKRGIGLVYGGAQIGVMGAVAEGARSAGGDVIGVIPETLMIKEVAHTGLSDLRVVPTMHDRKAMMAELADGFVALPGGCGTFEELFEVITWAQLGIHGKPCAILNIEGYFAPLIAMLDQGVRERFIRPDHRALLLVHTTIPEMLEAMESYRSTPTEKWVDI